MTGGEKLTSPWTEQPGGRRCHFPLGEPFRGLTGEDGEDKAFSVRRGHIQESGSKGQLDGETLSEAHGKQRT